jgi:hypothetical protein
LLEREFTCFYFSRLKKFSWEDWINK